MESCVVYRTNTNPHQLHKLGQPRELGVLSHVYKPVKLWRIDTRHVPCQSCFATLQGAKEWEQDYIYRVTMSVGRGYTEFLLRSGAASVSRT